MTTTFIGGGNMATALIGGTLARGASVGDIRVVEPSAAARAALATRYAGIALFAECRPEAIAGSALRVLPDAAHLANIEQPQRVTRLLLDHLSPSAT